MSLALLVLAGGRSRRMGRDKALLQLAGETLLARTVRLARQLAPTVAIACPDPDTYRSYVPEGVLWLPEAQPEGPQGPLAALTLALPQLAAEWVLLLACDLPRLRLEPLQQWARLLAPLPREIPAAVPHTARGWEPLCGFYRAEAVADLQAWLQAGRRDFQGWLADRPVLALPVGDDGMLTNCNTPGDWAAIATPLEDRL